MKSRAFVLAALCVATPALLAQGEKKAAGAEMQAPKQKEHEALKALVGSWESLTRTEAMPGVPGMEEPTESRGTEHSELICDGLWLKTVVSGVFDGHPFQGIWITGYDPFEKSYVGVWASSMEQDCGACLFDGSYDAAKKTWTWAGVTPHGEMRSTFLIESPDKTVETCYLRTPDGEETKCMEIIRRRAASPIAVDASGRRAENLLAEQERLLKEVGDWEATVEMAVPDEEPVLEKATERVSAICSGRWLWSEFRGRFQGAPFVGHALSGFDPVEKEYVSFWFDSTSPVFSKTSGTFDTAKKAYSLEGTTVDPTGKPTTIKETVTWKDDNTRLLQMEFTTEEQTSKMEILYKRKSRL